MGGQISAVQCIVFAEPECAGFEHVPFNAALLEVIELSYPGARIVRVAEFTHLENLAKIKPGGFQSEQAYVDRNEVILPRLARRGSSFGAQVFCALRSFLFIDSLARSERAQLVIFSSMNAKMYSLLRLARLLAPPKYLSIIFFHHVFHDIRLAPRNFIKKWLSLKYQLSQRTPGGMKTMVLGESIARNAIKYLGPVAAAEISSVDHPYPMPASGVGRRKSPDSRDGMTFSYVGVARSGFASFCEIAMRMKQEKRSSFLHIGKGTPSDIRLAQNAGVLGTRRDAVPREEMEALLARTTYIVGTAPPELYELSASGTFLDGVSRGIPGIYLRNDYIEYYFNKLGDIGYLCDSVDEIADVILKLNSHFSIDRYEQQVSQMISGRGLFSAGVVSESLRRIAGSLDQVHGR